MAVAQVESGTLAPGVNLEEAMDNYQTRVRATQRVIRDGRL